MDVVFEFTGHAKHVATDVAPTVAEYVPCPQLVHARVPVVILYLPAVQAEQTPPSGPVYPMLQVQPVDELHTVQVDPELSGQERHASAAVAPVVVEYVPYPQVVHAAEVNVVL